MILGKTFEELLDATLTRIVSSGTITNLSPGGIARAIAESICQNFSEYYGTLDINMMMAFLSTATGNYIDLIGYLLNCERLSGEEDDNYRYRITQQVYVAASANETAVRLRCLQVDGVRDIIVQEYTQGTGSFTICVIPETSTEIDNVVAKVQVAIDDVKGLGVKGVASKPKMIPLRLDLRLIFKNGHYDDQVANDVKRNVILYVENLSIGESFIVTELVQQIMDVSDDIKDLDFISFYVNNIPALLVNQDLYWDEKFYPDVIQIS